jgi:hypothetical protein
MRDLKLEYDSDPRDKKRRVISEEKQKVVKDFL